MTKVSISTARHHHLCLCVIALVLLMGCSSTPYQSRPLFLGEENRETHGRKTWFDHLMEADPGTTGFKISDDYKTSPPRKIAILPFADHGDGDYMLNKLPLSGRKEQERERWSWTHANRVRRAVTGALATREFTVLPLLGIDAVLADREISNLGELYGVPPEELGRWLGADALIYGDLLSYEAYYGFLVAAWKVSARVRMVSTLDGHEIFSSTGTRYSTNVNIVFDPFDIVINSVVTLVQLRDVCLARTEYEVGEEIILRLPTSERSISELQTAAREQSRHVDRATLPLIGVAASAKRVE